MTAFFKIWFSYRQEDDWSFGIFNFIEINHGIKARILGCELFGDGISISLVILLQQMELEFHKVGH